MSGSPNSSWTLLPAAVPVMRGNASRAALFATRGVIAPDSSNVGACLRSNSCRPLRTRSPIAMCVLLLRCARHRRSWSRYVPLRVPFPDLLRVLTLEPLGDDAFTACSPGIGPGQVFGGQLAAQALRAAATTVEADGVPNSLHARFLRPARPDVDVHITVDRVRDGSSFTTRAVSIEQEGSPVLLFSASFHADEPGEDWHPPVDLGEPPPAGDTVLAEIARDGLGTQFEILPASGSRPNRLHPVWIR